MSAAKREKYTASFKAKVIEEFFNGTTAKELEKKYGVKARIIYDWSRVVRSYENNKSKSSLSNSPINCELKKIFTKSVKIDNDVYKDTIDNLSNKDLKKMVQALEKNVKTLEAIINNMTKEEEK